MTRDGHELNIDFYVIIYGKTSRSQKKFNNGHNDGED